MQLAVPRGAAPQALSAQHRISPQPPLAVAPTIRLPEGEYLTPAHISAVSAMSNTPSAAVLHAKGLVSLGVQGVPEPRRHPNPQPPSASQARRGLAPVTVSDRSIKPEPVDNIPNPATLALAHLLKVRNSQITVDKNSSELYLDETQQTVSGSHPMLQSQLNQQQPALTRGHSPQPPHRGGHSPNPLNQRGPPSSPNSSLQTKLAPPVIQVSAADILSLPKVASDIVSYAHLPHTALQQHGIEVVPHILPEERAHEHIMNSDHSYGKDQTIHLTNHTIKQEVMGDTVKEEIPDMVYNLFIIL